MSRSLILFPAPADDHNFEDRRIKKVEGDRRRGWQISYDDGWAFWVSSESPIEPRVGMNARSYSRGVGCQVRGFFLDGVCLYYRTEDQQRQEHARWAREQDEKKKREFAFLRENLDLRYKLLPKVFQQRIDKFRRNNPDFRWEYESYEMFCCEEAVKIANYLETPERVDAFRKLDSRQQYLLVPLSDQHSGNTFGCACLLAYWYLKNPDNIVKLYGALAPLVGSEEYGCVPRKEAA